MSEANLKSIPCLICSEIPWRLVRDHDHRTGRIRGLLCDRCNNWLGTVEWKRKSNRKQRELANQYREQIARHLQRDAGMIFDPNNRKTTIDAAEVIAQLEHRIAELERED